jgi:methylated-DNA-[protein]-cysteine S-methyltransferase
MDGIFARESSYLGTWVQLGVASQQLVQVTFPPDPEDDASSSHELLDRIFAYLEGEREAFNNVEIALTVPTDHRAILTATREIPYGSQTTVEGLVGMAGLDRHDEEAIDSARAALAENPIPLIIPDHRVRDGPSGAPPEVEQRLRSLEGL